VLAVDVEDVLEVAPAEDEDPVEAVGAEGTDPAFGVCVRVRRLDRRAVDPGGLAWEHLLEGVAEFRVSVMDEEPDGCSSPSCMTRLRACWVVQPWSGLALLAT
jgi:hypothetical protein